MTETSDNTLVAQCLRGDSAGFDALFARYERPIYGLALQMLGRHADALDVLQSTFVKAFSHLTGYDSARKFTPWLFRIARNACIDAIRRRQRDEKQVSTLRDVASGAPDDPSVLAERTEAKERVWRALGTLSVQHREIIVLREFHGLAYREIAQVLDIAPGTVMSRLAAARKKLRSALEGMNHGL